jgi:hypothetical protein
MKSEDGSVATVVNPEFRGNRKCKFLRGES